MSKHKTPRAVVTGRPRSQERQEYEIKSSSENLTSDSEGLSDVEIRTATGILKVRPFELLPWSGKLVVHHIRTCSPQNVYTVWHTGIIGGPFC